MLCWGLLYATSGQVKNKSWFGIMDSYATLDENWSVLEANAAFASNLLSGDTAEAGEEAGLAGYFSVGSLGVAR